MNICLCLHQWFSNQSFDGLKPYLLDYRRRRLVFVAFWVTFRFLVPAVAAFRGLPLFGADTASSSSSSSSSSPFLTSSPFLILKSRINWLQLRFFSASQEGAQRTRYSVVFPFFRESNISSTSYDSIFWSNDHSIQWIFSFHKRYTNCLQIFRNLIWNCFLSRFGHCTSSFPNFPNLKIEVLPFQIWACTSSFPQVLCQATRMYHMSYHS